ncbi:Branched-chain amino acid ABC transporter, amino acid-binding protein [Candidatus Terasakiella magnetica]|uniref:Branched-chain amino acid ABC transporter, amino acid-binding protein n=1 Tax=Candidatus Terasakiella magnetica TaxID=1867952 RepID=A0A1C3RDZ4_9PROT|nr:ABC transporter substrate-binding protein [Candidatus Terasakiella magnetica]SCA55489.1 Branched-chain amino acid ABC transporter, amino acid-binding protein [Candidatus Terasakiella magnetica]
MTSRHNKIKTTIAALGMVTSALALNATDANAADPIKIGTFLAVTGPASFLGDPELKTLELYVEELNKSGGVLGRQVELVHYDTGAAPPKAIVAAKRLINQDKVDIIVGGSASGETMAVIPIVEKAGMPFISLAGSVKIVEPVKKWVFKTPHTDKMACGKIFEDLNSRGLNTIAMISGTGGFGKSMNGQCAKLAPAYKIKIATSETYGPKDTDMTAQLTKIKGVSGVQAVVNAGFGQGPAIVTKNYRQLGMNAPLYQSHGVASKSYIDLAGDAAEGVRLPAAALLVADVLPASDPQKAVVQEYTKAYTNAYGSSVSTFGGHAYDGLQMAVAAITRAGSTDKDAVRDEIEKTSGYIGTGGVVNMSATDHLGLGLSAFKMLEIKNGSWSLVK